MALPTHKIEIFKRYQSETWDNSYLVVAGSMGAAETIAAALVAFERSFHLTPVIFDYVRTSTTIVGDRTFDHLVLNVNGLMDVAGGILLPLFNTLRLDLRTDDSDPGRKYYRMCFVAENIESDLTLKPAFLTARQSLIDGLTDTPASLGVVTPKGNDVINQKWADTVQMRQLHRRRKKKVTTP